MMIVMRVTEAVWVVVSGDVTMGMTQYEATRMVKCSEVMTNCLYKVVSDYSYFFLYQRAAYPVVFDVSFVLR